MEITYFRLTKNYQRMKIIYQRLKTIYQRLTMFYQRLKTIYQRLTEIYYWKAILLPVSHPYSFAPSLITGTNLSAQKTNLTGKKLTTMTQSKFTIQANDLSFTFLNSGDLYEVANKSTMVNQWLSNEIDGSLNNLFLRIHGENGNLVLSPAWFKKSQH